ncbi:MAG: ABC transporter permease [Steroidobacteraceae bacterium]
MSLGIRPLLSALRRGPAGAILVALQAAITLAVLVNAAWLVSQHIEQLELPTGLDTQNIFAIGVGGLSRKFDADRAENEDLAYLRRLPGVAAATVNLGIPLTGEGSDYSRLYLRPGERGTDAITNVMTADDQALSTLGVSLIAGRNFTPYEIQPNSATRPPSEVIITEALAHALFPRGNALGRTVYGSSSQPLTIIGVARNYMGDISDPSLPLYNTMLLPEMPGAGGNYALVVRTLTGRRDAIMSAARQHIGAFHRDGVITDSKTLTEAKAELEANNRNMAIFLTIVTALMLAVCCLGIFGLTTFNVGSRTRQIGTRRAVGARRRDIVVYFMVENALILTAGALLGSVLALATGDWLTAHYSLPRLDLAYLVAGVVLLWVIGQLAAWQPARRAATVPPSVATRTV